MIRPAPGLTIEQQAEPIVLRMLLWGEARGERPLGKLAILWVVHNRAMKNDSTLRSEALKPRQFSCFNDEDPNRSKLLKADLIDANAWAVCDAVTSLFEARITSDPTGSSRNYFVASMLNPPEWSKASAGWQKNVVIGAHEFGNAA